ncbi:hypothetical protein OsJ_23250 [Oryza sativa Japonica Group]|uniref:Uncharacterized protein n=1 Tax=Oryza sativa subsp. japonica TaxID=39947 RepID=A3BGZ7_ORYSJ|nr:hypothetical protein OsJ_23250 [Oryza sativa Japonica Group]
MSRMHRIAPAPRVFTEKVRSKSAAAVSSRQGGALLVDHAGVRYGEGDVSLDGHGAASEQAGLPQPWTRRVAEDEAGAELDR